MAPLARDLLYLLTACAGTFLLTCASVWLLSRKAAKQPALPWYERARLLWPARLNGTLQVGLLPTIFTMLPISVAPHGASSLPGAWVWTLSFISGLLAFACFRNRFTNLPTTYADWWKGWAASQLILGLPWVITGFAIAFGDYEWDTAATIKLIAVVILLLAHTFGGALFLGRKFGLITPAPPRLQAIVQNVCNDLKVPPPTTLVFHTRFANAFALPFSKSLGFCDRLVENFSDEAIAGITRHEMAHLSEPLRVHLARLVFIPFLIPLAMVREIVGEFGFPVWGISFLCMALVVILFKKLSRKMETRADSHAANEDGPEYAQALERLHELNLIPAVLTKRGTHPDLYDRLTTLGAAPSYERPAPPRLISAYIMLIVTGAVAACVAAWFQVGR